MSAHKAPTSAHTFVIHEGKRFGLVNQPGRGWRLRSRSKHAPIDALLGLGSESWAKKRALEILRGDGVLRPRAHKSVGTLADLAAAYKAMPKRAGEAAQVTSLSRLATVTRVALGKELAAARVDEIRPSFWMAYCAKKQGRDVADLSTRRVENKAINAAMRQAAAVLAPKLRPVYAEMGFDIRPDATVIQWLPEMNLPAPAAKGADLLEAWGKLRSEDFHLWLCVGLARFAGLRRGEIENAMHTWVEADGAATYICLRDRPEQGWNSKTGRPYRAPVVNADLAAALHALPPGYLVNPPKEDRARWFERRPQEWLRPFTGKAIKPLHRLRCLYADDLAKMTEDAVKARLEGVKAASEALGHTTTATTQAHYLSEK